MLISLIDIGLRRSKCDLRRDKQRFAAISAAKSIQPTLDEKKHADRLLTEVAERTNTSAATAA
jgi:hypothetical protein